MSKAVIFDWGGVLMRTRDYSPRLAWDKRLGLLPGSVERVVHGLPEWIEVQLGQRDPDTYWQAVAEQLHLPTEMLPLLQSDFYRGDRLDEDLVILIRRLRMGGIRVALLSNNGPDLLDQIEALGLSDLFDAVVISCQIGQMKPHIGAYLTTLGKLAVSPERSLLIDDSEANVEGARAAGMAAIRFYPDLDLMSALEQWLSATSP